MMARAQRASHKVGAARDRLYFACKLQDAAHDGGGSRGAPS